MFGIKSRLLRNSKSFGGEKSPNRKIILEYWKSKVNIGDALAPVIYEYMLKKKWIV
ncbi:MAG: hypothetical protein ACLRZY_07930 [Blautia hansenii]